MRAATRPAPLRGAQAPQRVASARRHVCAAAAPAGREAAEQVTFTSPLPRREDVSVGIIGGGLAGAPVDSVAASRRVVSLTRRGAGVATAAALSAHGISSVVYDTGEHGVGGRLGTRELGRDRALVFDHAAQYFTASDPRFKESVARWLAAGVVAPWTGGVGALSASGAFTPLPNDTRYYATAGMRSLAEYVLGNESPLAVVKRPCWVGEMRADTSAGIWRFRQNGRELDQHHFTVISHNGKCANRLLRPSGAPLVDAQMARMKLSSIWCLMVAFASPLGAPFEGAHVAGLPALSWAGNNTAKLGLTGSQQECWSLFSSAAYGRANKCPQEAVPAEVAQRVTADMLDALSKALGKPLPPATFTRTQLWGAALPTNTPRVPVIFDGSARVAMCGDWLTGASLEDAALSGQAAADVIAAAVAESHAGKDSLAHLSAGLHARFVPVGASDIGTADVRQAAKPAEGAASSGRSYVSRGERRNAKGALQAEVRDLNRSR
jgi:predicted NAD/FAD-dependent oxidoreductase